MAGWRVSILRATWHFFKFSCLCSAISSLSAAQMSLSKFFIPHSFSKPSHTAACRLGFFSFPSLLRLLEVPDWDSPPSSPHAGHAGFLESGRVDMLRFWYNPAVLRGLCVTPSEGLLPLLEKSQCIFSDKWKTPPHYRERRASCLCLMKLSLSKSWLGLDK